jgi:hypothetical protein
MARNHETVQDAQSHSLPPGNQAENHNEIDNTGPGHLLFVVQERVQRDSAQKEHQEDDTDTQTGGNDLVS